MFEHQKDAYTLKARTEHSQETKYPFYCYTVYLHKFLEKDNKVCQPLSKQIKLFEDL